jgi:Protein of unknown function (DUF4007)
MTSATASSLRRFEYGRHETFTIRHGWLSKGLAQIQDGGGFQVNLETADSLGLGSKMVKSLSYWLEASGLASAALHGRSRQLAISPIGLLIAQRDPYFEFPTSWWFVHISLAIRDASVFAWFFNDFPERSFDRSGCLDAFQRYLRDRATKSPSIEIAQRDVSCVLASYADEFGKLQDPEDGIVCPLTDLGLLRHHRDTRRFEKVSRAEKIPVEVFLGCVSKLGHDSGLEALSVVEMATKRHGPGRILNMQPDAIDAAAVEAAGIYGRSGVTFELLGAERRLRAAHKHPEYWLERHYDRIGAAA